ncbi:hypothetical protein CERZMDRAFT_100028 [Cercospora zeae-maydis SCOH1-5]|uniref:Uncharacterized protein n=1 Tax=Cercospora zeae-maydis SCOH1-5 TaxID=717836 RepID=A0A6A6F9B0_9PEZI|nr:hypothetical protein CERZMDRAFT_100028 [Cercospora zeae-maydis SCOH1-5]
MTGNGPKGPAGHGARLAHLKYVCKRNSAPNRRPIQYGNTTLPCRQSCVLQRRACKRSRGLMNVTDKDCLARAQHLIEQIRTTCIQGWLFLKEIPRVALKAIQITLHDAFIGRVGVKMQSQSPLHDIVPRDQ